MSTDLDARTQWVRQQSLSCGGSYQQWQAIKQATERRKARRDRRINLVRRLTGRRSTDQ